MDHLTTVRLYGDLGERFGREHAFAIGSPAEAVRALRANFPGFESAIRADGRYLVLSGKRQLGEDELSDPTGRVPVRIVPIVSGGGGSFGRIVIGAALVALTAWNPGGFFTAGLFGTTATVGAISSAIGWAMVLGGVGQMLFAPTKSDPAATEAPQNKPSYAFDGAVNTTAQGLPVPVCYGQLMVGSAVISSGMYAEDIAV